MPNTMRALRKRAARLSMIMLKQAALIVYQLRSYGAGTEISPFKLRAAWRIQ